MAKNKMKINVAIQQHFLSHYRQGIFELLGRQRHPDPEYYFFSDYKNSIGIKLIDVEDSSSSSTTGWLRWNRVRNFSIGRFSIFQPRIILLGFNKKFDCIIYSGCMYDISTWISAIIARILGKRILMWTHGYLSEEKNFKGFLRSVFYRISHGLLLYGERAKQILIDKGFDENSLYVVYNSLDYENQNRIRNCIAKEDIFFKKRKVFMNPDLRTIIFIGRLTEQKQLNVLFHAVHMLKSEGFRLNVLLVGEGPELIKLRESAKDLGIDDCVVFYGPCYSEDEIGPLIMMSEVCVSPGEVGLNCIHSLMYGTPVITHGTPQFQGPEWEAITPGVTGSFFREGDPVDLARVIRDWFNSEMHRDVVAEVCHNVVKHRYNPKYQIKIFNAAVLNYDA